MAQPAKVAGATFCVMVFIRFILKLYVGRGKRKQTTVLSTTSSCHAILNGNYASATGAALLHARAGPNQRLRRCFGVNNAFTSSDETLHTGFKDSATKMIRLNFQQWLEIRDAARSSIIQELDLQRQHQGCHKQPIPIIPLMQGLTLGPVLHLIRWQYPNQTKGVTTSVTVLHSLAEAINQSWMMSKVENVPFVEAMLSRWRLRQYMLKALPPHRKKVPFCSGIFGKLVHTLSYYQTLRWLVVGGQPGADYADMENPINYILPAYETTWRVALLCLVEIRERSRYGCGVQRKDVWIKLLRGFLESPTKSQLCKRAECSLDTDQPAETAEMIAKEALRLYPPTRRVYRDFDAGPTTDKGSGPWVGSAKISLAADVEACQRNNISFTNSKDPVGLQGFWPARWAHIPGRVERNEFLAFGATPLQCPARAGFGYSMIALLVAVVLEAFDDEWDFIATVDEMKDVRSPEAPLRTGRSDYKGFAFVHK
ncbi:MAG: hypothetical protein LQ340_000442 [Diploschistes diacapsis]|nr:MAG: hypothetical protein LQ340_000442 [Diploschistes diacapsis]